MTDPCQQLDDIIGGFEKLSLLTQLNDKVIEARSVSKRECGNCYFWMMSRECPRERNVNSQSRGPSMSMPACDKFQIEQWVLQLQQQRISEAIEFADRHNLQIPAGLAKVSSAS